MGKLPLCIELSFRIIEVAGGFCKIFVLLVRFEFSVVNRDEFIGKFVVFELIKNEFEDNDEEVDNDEEDESVL